MTTSLASLTPVTWGVLFFLSLYLIAVFWIFIARMFSLTEWVTNEQEAVDALVRGMTTQANLTALQGCIRRNKHYSESSLAICLHAATKEATKGLTVLSVIASTSPFVGLFGTVVSILQTFASMGSSGQASMSVLAPQISEALIATAAGILVAIFAYAFFALLKRKAHEVIGYLTMHKDLLLSEPI